MRDRIEEIEREERRIIREIGRERKIETVKLNFQSLWFDKEDMNEK